MRAVVTCSECQQTAKKIRRGLCDRCYTRHRRAGDLPNVAAPSRRHSDTVLPADYVAEEWEFLSSCGVTKDQAAAQLGMTRAAFDKALTRHATTTTREDDVA
jgi:hypothetical protein